MSRSSTTGSSRPPSLRSPHSKRLNEINTKKNSRWAIVTFHSLQDWLRTVPEYRTIIETVTDKGVALRRTTETGERGKVAPYSHPEDKWRSDESFDSTFIDPDARTDGFEDDVDEGAGIIDDYNYADDYDYDE